VTLSPYRLRVDGQEHRVVDGRLGDSLLRVLRDRLGVTAVKEGCATGDCGTCAVLVDGTLVNGCLVLAAAAAGREVTTASGLSHDGGATDVQRAFAEAGAVQCGFCAPGLVLAAHELLTRTPAPGDAQIREALSGNRCACAGFERVVEAVRRVAAGRSS
jgi:aerobic-type carbon monoxide dehydrogenase small subunit (CoxS/CutS family)